MKYRAYCENRGWELFEFETRGQLLDAFEITERDGYDDLFDRCRASNPPFVWLCPYAEDVHNTRLLRWSETLAQAEVEMQEAADDV